MKALLCDGKMYVWYSRINRERKRREGVHLKEGFDGSYLKPRRPRLPLTPNCGRERERGNRVR